MGANSMMKKITGSFLMLAVILGGSALAAAKPAEASLPAKAQQAVQKAQDKVEKAQAKAQEKLEKAQVKAQEKMEKAQAKVDKAKLTEEEKAALRARPLEDRIKVKGNNLKLDVPPVIKEGRTLIPVRAVSQGLGADVVWDADSKTITITRGDVKVVLVLDKAEYWVNGQVKTLDVPAQLVSNRTFVPLRFIAEALGEKVAYDPDTGDIDVGEEDDEGTEDPVSQDSNQEGGSNDTEGNTGNGQDTGNTTETDQGNNGDQSTNTGGTDGAQSGNGGDTADTEDLVIEVPDQGNTTNN